MARSFVVVSLAFAGIFVLAGAGWALLAGAGLALVFWPQGAETAAAAWRRKAVLLARDLARKVAERPRKAVGATGMAGGLALVPAGIAGASGIGAGIAVAGGLLIGLALLTGWGA